MTDTAANPEGSEKSVLYIEDNPVNLTLIKKIIEKKTSYRFLSAIEPVAGLECAQQEKPDLILLDIFLPGMDGYEVLKRLQAAPETANIPVVALSANAMRDDIVKGHEAGFIDYLSKPIDVAGFLQTINKLLGST